MRFLPFQGTSARICNLELFLLAKNVSKTIKRGLKEIYRLPMVKISKVLVLKELFNDLHRRSAEPTSAIERFQFFNTGRFNGVTDRSKIIHQQ